MKALVSYFVKYFWYIKKYNADFAAIIKWFVYLVSDVDKLVGAWLTCAKTELIRGDQVILKEKVKHWAIE